MPSVAADPVPHCTFIDPCRCRYPQGVYIGWEVPLSFTSNRLLVSATFTGSASQFSNKTNDHGKQEDSSRSSKGAVVSGRVNSGSGSEAYYIFSIK